MGVVVAAGHPFARRRQVTREQMCGEPIVVYSRKEYPDYPAFVSRSVGPGSKRLRVVEGCDSGTSLAASVASGKGICLTSSIFVLAAGRHLAFVPLDPPPARAVVALAYREGDMSAAMRALVELVSEMSVATDPGLR